MSHMSPLPETNGEINIITIIIIIILICLGLLTLGIYFKYYKW